MQGVNADEGQLFDVEFDDGTTRRMRRLVQKVRLCYAWLDMESAQVVVQTWLITPGRQRAGPKPMRFSVPEGASFPPAFGGAMVTKMAPA